MISTTVRILRLLGLAFLFSLAAFAADNDAERLIAEALKPSAL